MTDQQVGRRGRRGRPQLPGIVSPTLIECLKSAVGPGMPFLVTICGKELYVWTSSSANAVRMAAYYLGATASAIPPYEMLQSMKGDYNASDTPKTGS